jgi:hypothetical protein
MVKVLQKKDKRLKYKKKVKKYKRSTYYGVILPSIYYLRVAISWKSYRE